MQYVEPRGRVLTVTYNFWVLGSEEDVALISVTYRDRNVVWFLSEETLDYLCRRAGEGVFRIECRKKQSE